MLLSVPPVTAQRPLVNHPRALGMELTIYDPMLDPELTCARRLVDLVVSVLIPAPP